MPVSLTFLQRIRQEWEQAQSAVSSQFEELQAQLAPSLTTYDATVATVAAVGVSVVPPLATGVGLTLSIFTSGGGATANWFVTAAQVLNWSYCMIGPRLLLDFAISPSTVSGTPNQSLQIALPKNYVVARYASAGCVVSDNGTFVAGMILATPGQRVIQIRRADQANWATPGTATTSVFGQLLVEVM